MLPRLLRPLRPALRLTALTRPNPRPSALPRQPFPAARSYWQQSPREWWRRFSWEVDLDDPFIPLLMVMLPFLSVGVYYAIKEKQKPPKTNAFGDVVVRDGEEATYGPPETKLPQPPAAPWNPPGE
ncbi:uncharacterized protein LOC62_02G003469 [Vanrija pseudolonga]|uniref:Uncharacterized protein n=1 Tax=Vanrija pseudolonga TaxID=143232 RepID=A0AAF0Y4F9_9TREE|nr:hypothetical protein LOC62_02G003469 [Vanrija pseudolonga]